MYGKDVFKEYNLLSDNNELKIKKKKNVKKIKKNLS